MKLNPALFARVRCLVAALVAVGYDTRSALAQIRKQIAQERYAYAVEHFAMTREGFMPSHRD